MKVNNVELIISAVRRSQYPTDNKPEFLLVGRSNVGKSSFINTILNRKNLARTSSSPGKTQTINFYLVNDTFYLVDAPGYGFAKIGKQKRQKFGLMMEDYLVERPNLKQVFMFTQQQKQRNTIFNELDVVVGDDFIVFSNINKTGKSEVHDKIYRTL